MKKTSNPPDNIILSKSGQKPRYHRRSLIWIGLAALVLLLSNVLPGLLLERWYYHGVFGWIRVAYDALFGWSPLPMIYVVALIVFVRIVKWFNNWNKGFLFQLNTALGGVACLVSLFYLLWGFNYRQIPLQERLGLQLDEVSEVDVESEFIRATNDLKKEAALLPDHFTSDHSIATLKITDHDLRPEVEKALADLGVPGKGHVRVRQLWPNGFLLRWSTAGIYIPHALEGHVDNGLLSVQKPFTIAHEMAHGYGVTDEGACNFVAWLACRQSRDHWIRFGGAFTYWRYVAAEMPDEKVREVLHTFDPVVTRAITLVHINDKKYPDILPAIRDAIYSSYLERHGVKGGLQSYNYVVKMVHQYLAQQSKTNDPIEE